MARAHFGGHLTYGAGLWEKVDMAGFGVVRAIGDGWEPKAAFHELARFYSSH
ncbi:hypothetical protein ACFC0C_09640 [Streptomyces sp. NPDC056178]|uniref:hypothetical protein n=1 Tax=unclassified Streptomyces TaxID=2593676 RepID=UPI0035E012EB